MTETLLIEYSPAVSQRRRIRFEPRQDGVGYCRIEEVWDGGEWRHAGQEIVMDLSIRTPAE
jgi:hypothetical protein